MLSEVQEGGIRCIRVMDKLIGHCADLKGGDESKPVFHFRRDRHSEEDMGVVVLEQICRAMNRMGVSLDEKNKRR